MNSGIILKSRTNSKDDDYCYNNLKFLTLSKSDLESSSYSYKMNLHMNKNNDYDNENNNDSTWSKIMIKIWFFV